MEKELIEKKIAAEESERMAALKESIPPMLLSAMKHPGAREIIEEWAKNTMSHHHNPLYSHAAAYWSRVQVEQINKGAAKYPEPLKSQSWTLEQLIDHAMQEVVDETHYLTALREKADEIAISMFRLDMAEKAIQAIVDITSGDNEEGFDPSRILNRIGIIARGYFMASDAAGKEPKKSCY